MKKRMKLDDIIHQLNILFYQKNKIEKQIQKFHNYKEEILSDQDLKVIKTIPKDITKINKKQWKWILTITNNHSMVQYKFRQALLINYGINCFGYHMETKQPVMEFFNYGFNPDKVKKIFKILKNHIKPITAKDRGYTEIGIRFQVTGLEDDITSVIYVHKKGDVALYVDKIGGPKSFSSFDAFADWYNDNRKKDL